MNKKPTKFVLSIAILFVLGQLTFTIKGVQTLPFINYGMYSSPQNLSKTYSLFEIKINDEVFDFTNCKNINEDFLIYNVNFYKNLSDNNFIDPSLVTINSRFENKLSKEQYQYIVNQLTNDEKSGHFFAIWLQQYLAHAYQAEIEKISLSRKTFTWENEDLNLQKSTLFFDYEY